MMNGIGIWECVTIAGYRSGCGEASKKRAIKMGDVVDDTAGVLNPFI
jgi:hypothetical protein